MCEDHRHQNDENDDDYKILTMIVAAVFVLPVVVLSMERLVKAVMVVKAVVGSQELE